MNLDFERNFSTILSNNVTCCKIFSFLNVIPFIFSCIYLFKSIGKIKSKFLHSDIYKFNF